MSGSLQDQLLKAGLADAQKAKSISKEKRKKDKVAKHLRGEVNSDVQAAVREAAEAKAARDKALNAAQNAAALRKAINAQIKQLIEQHRESRGAGKDAFNFTDGKKIKKLYVDAGQRRRLVAGLLKIVKQGDQYELLPAPIADKIAQRDPTRIIDCRASGEPELTTEEKEWYADFEIPDDLDW